MQEAYTRFGKPIWLTEFAGSGTVAEQQAFFATVLPWMEKQLFIERYAGLYVHGLLLLSPSFAALLRRPLSPPSLAALLRRRPWLPSSFVDSFVLTLSSCYSGDFVGTYVNSDASLTPLGQAYSAQ